jgi:ribosomal protein L11 methyltransferase
LKNYPAVVVRHLDPDAIAALVDDFSPTAIEPRDGDVRVFFTSPGDRDAACTVLATKFAVAAIEVSDEDWARRSQEDLPPVVVGRLTILAKPDSRIPNPSRISNRESLIPNPATCAIVIVPSMGFGTGHHATTRLCLEALQAIDLEGRDVLDVGTGSGVLAIAAAALGAAGGVGVASDADAIQSARENVALNPAARGVAFVELDVTRDAVPSADVVTANLTGTLLARTAAVLGGAVRRGGTLILSGLLAHERDEVYRAFASMPVVWEREEDGWVGLAVKRT